MSTALLKINLSSIVDNWRALDAMSAGFVETAAVVKANGYGLDAGRVSAALAKAGVKTFFVAVAEEGIAVRKAVGPMPEIYIFSGIMLSDARVLAEHKLIPLINAPEQLMRFRAELPDSKFGIQLDSGMNRLGMEPEEFVPLRDVANEATLVMSHLACADEPEHPQNNQQLEAFRSMTDGLNCRRSLAATGGTIMGAKYHFDLCRPGIGLYGGAPFKEAKPVITVKVPVIQVREVKANESVGYSATWVAQQNTMVATLAAGYADGLIRAMGNGEIKLYGNETPCPLIGRVSMDLLTVDVSRLDEVPEYLELINTTQTVDRIADAAGTIGYEVLTNLGMRYTRQYIEA